MAAVRSFTVGHQGSARRRPGIASLFRTILLSGILLLWPARGCLFSPGRYLKDEAGRLLGHHVALGLLDDEHVHVPHLGRRNDRCESLGHTASPRVETLREEDSCHSRIERQDADHSRLPADVFAYCWSHLRIHHVEAWPVGSDEILFLRDADLKSEGLEAALRVGYPGFHEPGRVQVMVEFVTVERGSLQLAALGRDDTGYAKILIVGERLDGPADVFS